MGTLYIVATPIGNLDDISLRALKTLSSVDYIVCEDTRKTGQMIKNYEARVKNQELKIDILKKPKFISYYDEIELKRVPEIIDILKSGKSVALVSNAGTPLICDPGFKLVKECIKQSLKIVPIPGPTSLVTALSLSGLPTNQFLFLGYLPKKQKKRKEFLNELKVYFKSAVKIKPTVIFFETPHRLIKSLSDIKDVFGDIEIVIARELTKIHEKIIRGKISNILSDQKTAKGEIVLLMRLQAL